MSVISSLSKSLLDAQVPRMFTRRSTHAYSLCPPPVDGSCERKECSSELNS